MKFNTVYKAFKQGVFSGSYFPIFGINTRKHEPVKPWSEDLC